MPDAELTLTKFRTVAKELVELLEADYPLDPPDQVIIEDQLNWITQAYGLWKHRTNSPRLPHPGLA